MHASPHRNQWTEKRGAFSTTAEGRSKCALLLPLSAFRRNRARPRELDSLHSRCKPVALARNLRRLPIPIHQGFNLACGGTTCARRQRGPLFTSGRELRLDLTAARSPPLPLHDRRPPARPSSLTLLRFVATPLTRTPQHPRSASSFPTTERTWRWDSHGPLATSAMCIQKLYTRGDLLT